MCAGFLQGTISALGFESKRVHCGSLEPRIALLTAGDTTISIVRPVGYPTRHVRTRRTICVAMCSWAGRAIPPVFDDRRSVEEPGRCRDPRLSGFLDAMGRLSYPRWPSHSATTSRDRAGSGDRTTGRSRRARQRQTRLVPTQIDELVERRRAGATIAELAEVFAIHSTTVMAHPTPSDHTHVTQPNGLRATPQPSAFAGNRASSTTSPVSC